MYLIATVSNGSKHNEEMQRRAVGHIKLETAENFALHPQQLVLRIGVVHQVAESRHLKDKIPDVNLHLRSTSRLKYASKNINRVLMIADIVVDRSHSFGATARKDLSPLWS